MNFVSGDCVRKCLLIHRILTNKDKLKIMYHVNKSTSIKYFYLNLNTKCLFFDFVL